MWYYSMAVQFSYIDRADSTLVESYKVRTTTRISITRLFQVHGALRLKYTRNLV